MTNSDQIRPSSPYYSDERVTLWHADCREVMAAMPPASIQAIITDPPYNVTEINGRDGTTVGKVRRADGSYRDVTRNFGDWDRGFEPRDLTAAAERLLVDRGAFLAFTSDRLIGAYMDSPLHHMRTLVWLKSNPAPQFPGNYQSACEWIVWQGKGGPPVFNGGGAVSNVHTAPIPGGKVHPCEKPLGLMGRLVAIHTRPGDVVLDPFAGSGTTLRAVVDAGRRAVGIEADERYCEVIAKRLAQGSLDFGGAA